MLNSELLNEYSKHPDSFRLTDVQPSLLPRLDKKVNFDMSTSESEEEISNGKIEEIYDLVKDFLKG